MEIKIAKTYKGSEHWDYKSNVAIFVDSEYKAAKLAKALVTYDEDWKKYLHLIKVFIGGTIIDIEELDEYCGYNGKCLISDEIIKKHDFLIHYSTKVC